MKHSKNIHDSFNHRRESTNRQAITTFQCTYHHDGNSAQPIGRGGGACPPPFILYTITSKDVVYAAAERAYTLLLFLLYPFLLCTVVLLKLILFYIPICKYLFFISTHMQYVNLDSAQKFILQFMPFEPPKKKRQKYSTLQQRFQTPGT